MSDETSKSSDEAEALFTRMQDHLRNLVRRIRYYEFPDAKRWEETDDALNVAFVRFWNSERTKSVKTDADFLKYMARQIRWTMLDHLKKLYGNNGFAKNHESKGRNPFGTDASTPDSPQTLKSDGPVSLAQWTEFHELVDRLPEPVREVFELRWYCGLKLAEIAQRIGVERRTISRRWKDAIELIASDVDRWPI